MSRELYAGYLRLNGMVDINSVLMMVTYEISTNRIPAKDNTQNEGHDKYSSNE